MEEEKEGLKKMFAPTAGITRDGEGKIAVN